MPNLIKCKNTLYQPIHSMASIICCHFNENRHIYDTNWCCLLW